MARCRFKSESIYQTHITNVVDVGQRQRQQINNIFWDGWFLGGK